MLKFKVKTLDPTQTRQVAKKVKRRNTHTDGHIMENKTWIQLRKMYQLDANNCTNLMQTILL